MTEYSPQDKYMKIIDRSSRDISKGCSTCKYCKEHKYIFECEIGRATECCWDNEYKLWKTVVPPDFIREEEMVLC